MYWILFVMGAIAAMVIALVVGGLVTPRTHAVARTTVVPAALDTVWNTVHDVARYAEWRDEIESAELVDQDQPQRRWRESNMRGSVTFGIVVDEGPHRLVARILDDDLPFTGEWTWQIEPAGDATRVTITEHGSIGNPLFRFIGAHLLGYTRSMDRYLRALATHHGASAVSIADAPAAKSNR